VLLEARHRPFAEMDLRAPGLPDGFESHRRLERRVGVFVTSGPAVIEPSEGWVVGLPLSLHERAVIDAEFHPHPTIRRYVVDRARLPTRRVAGPVASLRTIGEGNHFHLLLEVLGGRLRLVGEHVPPGVPVIVPSWLQGNAVFRRAVEVGVFAGRDLVFQGHEYLRADAVYFFETSRYDEGSVEFVRRWFDVDPAPLRRRRIFVTRPAGAGRTIVNEADVLGLLLPLGFEILDPGRLSFAEQVSTFASASHVIGIHGAGLTNVVFGGRDGARVLEIHPPRPSKWGGPAADYFFLCRSLGHRYDGIIGIPVAEDSTWASPFRVDLEELRAALDRLMER
jgi:hypothetical protein